MQIWLFKRDETRLTVGTRSRFMIIPDMLKNAPMFKRLDAKIKVFRCPTIYFWSPELPSPFLGSESGTFSDVEWTLDHIKV